MKNKNKIKTIVSDIVFFLLIGVIATFGLVNFLDNYVTAYKVPFFGYRSSVIISESMSYANEVNTYLDNEDYNIGRIQKYDIVTTKMYKSYEDIQLYDVITYYYQGTLVCHRVIDKYIDEETNHKCLITRGDANNISDLDPVTWGNVRGKVISVVSGTGKIVLFIQSPYFLLALCGSLFFIFLGFYIYDHNHEKKQKQKG